MSPVTPGDFVLDSVAALPNVTVAFPGEHWSDRIASGTIVPGEAVIPVNFGGKLAMVRATTAQASAGVRSGRTAIALQTVLTPDTNRGPAWEGPNELVNKPITSGNYVHAYYSGAFHLTLVEPAAYVPGDLLAWDDAAARPTGKDGTGAWSRDGATDANALFEVIEFRKVNVSNEGIVTVRSLRGQF